MPEHDDLSKHADLAVQAYDLRAGTAGLPPPRRAGGG